MRSTVDEATRLITNEEENFLRHNQKKQYDKRRKLYAIYVTLFALFLIGLSFLISRKYRRIPRNSLHHSIGSSSKKNLIFMISDGFGPASQTFARNYDSWSKNLSYNHQLPLDYILVGSSRTRSSSSLVTDSAAGATAFSCILKTYNGAIGVDPNGLPCGTVLEAAKLSGYMTGLVVTSRITHATPASFAAHVPDRAMESLIALHEIGNYSLGRMTDLLFGGGECFFLPNSTASSCRTDNIDVFAKAKELGWNVNTGLESFSKMKSTAQLPIINLFANDHMSYEIDRDSKIQPSLKEMVEKAIDILTYATKNSPNGFFLMIEGSRIDMAGHSNDAAAHVHDILAYNDAIEYVKGYVDRRDDTVMVSVSDHETGGLSVAYQSNKSAYPDYLWKPEVLRNVQNSSEIISAYLITNGLSHDINFLREIVFEKWLGLNDVSELELGSILGATNPNALTNSLADLISVRAQLGWATHGHSAVDVNLYAYGVDSHLLAGNNENTDVGQFIQKYLKIDVRQVTKMLTSGMHLEYDSIPEESVKKSMHLLHYHNDGHNCDEI